VNEDEAPGMVCRAYTGARRHPKVVGVIGGHVMPFPSTNTQLGTFLGLAIALVKSRVLWAAFTPIPVQFFVIVGLPCVGWWAVRYWHPEGREPFKAVVGGINYLVRPQRGSIDGRPASRRTTTVVHGACFYMGDPDA
jgi:hypothetical protein